MLNNKKHHLSSLLILLLLMGLVLAACQRAEEPIQELCPVDELGEEQGEDCLTTPPELESEEAAYPIEEFAFVDVDEAAYPITQADLSVLLKTWHLTAYTKDGQDIKPPFRYLTFYDDGTYAIATEPDLITGNWTSFLSMVESALVFDPGTEREARYQIIDMDEAVLNLRSWQGVVQIDEGYEPDENGCVCD